MEASLAHWRSQTAERDESDARDGGVVSFTIGELPEEFRVSLRTLRFYETRGLLSPARRAGERRFSQDDRRRIEFILQAKRFGFSLREIQTLMVSRSFDPDLLPFSRQECTQQINLLERQKRDIETALAELRRVYSSHYTKSLRRGS